MATLNNEIKRQIGQHFVFGFHGFDLNDDIKSLLRDYYVGNVILMKRNVKDATQVRKLVCDLQTFARSCGHEKPLLIGIDQENGLVSAFSSLTAGTQFPGAMAMAATGSAELAEKVAVSCGQELKLVGINWVYSPVADVNSDPRNPVIGVRSFGDDPETVARFACAVSRGLASTGVAPCAKHFPGHGDTHVDSHVGLPKIMKNIQALKQTELVPFEALVNLGVASVMTGHMALPLMTGGDVPSSLSAVLTRKLLRQEMKYEGVVVTDCLEMDAVASVEKGGIGVEEGAVRALEAGADVAMICHTYQRQVGSVKAVWKAIEHGRLEMERLREGRQRIAKMKDAFGGSWDEVTDANLSGFEERWKDIKARNTELSRDAYRRSTTLAWDHGGVLPLKRNAPGVMVLFTPEIESLNRAVDDAEELQRTPSGAIRNTAGASYRAFARAVGKQTRMRHIVYSMGDVTVDLRGEGEELSGIIFVLRNANRAVWQRQILGEVLKQRTKEVALVVVSSCEPYDVVGEEIEKKEELVAHVLTYEFTTAALEAAAEMMFV
ncbi:glycoside hydrolase family 3 protein [Amanita thiersii Skay4041]|uniref:Glycoside hydrolase family 3 protein n=1 Tax=Amanita thiersii Skay4041 TaxID=703135 RepID=A0A2A9NNV6_9AGAR|nr:glycoside hydrolase family 3 protein [Amanita thiersii Skay4041]